MKGCFERGVFWRAKSRLKGIEDFNLEYCLAHIAMSKEIFWHIGRDPSVSKSNQFNVDILQLFFIELGYVL